MLDQLHTKLTLLFRKLRLARPIVPTGVRSQSPLTRCFDHPEALPASLRSCIAEALGNQNVRMYALCDLDADQRFAVSWLVLTDRSLVLADASVSGRWSLQTRSLADVADLILDDGLTCQRLRIVGADARLWATVSFTRRQCRAVSNLQFVAKQWIENLRRQHDGTAPGLQPDQAQGGVGADAEYQAAVLHSLGQAKGDLVVSKTGVMLRLLGYLKPYKAQALLSFVLVCSITMLHLLPPYLTKVLVDDVLQPVQTGRLANPGPWLWVIIVSLALVWSLAELCSFLRMRLMALTGEKIATRLRLDIYSHMQTLSLSFFSAHPTGSLITRVSSDTDQLWEFVTFGMVDMVVAVLQIIGVAAALLLQDWSLALLVLLPLPLMTAMFYWYSRKVQTLSVRIWRKWALVTNVLSDVIPGIRVVKAFAQEQYEVERFREKSAALEVEGANLHRMWTRFWPSIVMLMHGCSLIVWGIGAPRVLRYVETGGAEGMPLGVFIAFTGYMWSFWAPVQQLGMMSRTISRVATSAHRVFEVLDTVPSVVSKPNAVRLPRLRGDVTFDNVSFSYEGVRNVLRGISFAARSGEMIGLVGPSGSGKTTAVNLLCRFYDVQEGAVRLDGLDVRDLDLACMRQQIGVVLQEPYLFCGTIAENIAYGARDAELSDVIAAAKAANVHDSICAMTDGYETRVGERGQTLSGGERQRLSIARALLHDPRILILDEATSSVDSESEKKIQEALQRLVAGRTTFAIAHRLSTLSAADRLLVLEDGKLLEQGTHQALLTRPDGLYARLYNSQIQLHAVIGV